MTPGQLVPIDAENWRAALEVTVTEEQLPMVAESQPVAMVILAKAHVRDGDRQWEPLAFVDSEGAIVAVLGLTHADGVGEVGNFAVDQARQRSGIGTMAMRAVIDHCRQAGLTAVELTHHPANEPAARLYRKIGFGATGQQRNGEPILRITVNSRE